jgi:conserved oligomeric Golgi complex subunit 6
MSNDYFLTRRPSDIGGLDSSPISLVSPATSFHASRSHLSSKVTNVLSASYADSEIRDALSLLDERGIESNAEARRKLRLDIQKEVIDSNGDIIREFSLVAEVCGILTVPCLQELNLLQATETYRPHYFTP